MKSLPKNILAYLFFAALLISWCMHVSFRNDHFQDVDSATVYQMMHEFPGAALRATALFYPEGSIFSTSTATEILKNPLVRSVKDKHLSSFSDEFIINQLAKTSLSGAVRFASIQAVASLGLPYPLQSFFSVPLSSTYSAGVGLVYGLVSGPDTSYEDFMSRTTVIVITLFHASMLLLFLINRRLGVSDLPNGLVSLIALFSISMYSSGMHLGSTVWNFASAFLWIFLVQKWKDSPQLGRNISWLTAGMVFFNYLIVFLWAAYMLVTLMRARTEARDIGAGTEAGVQRFGKLAVLTSWAWNAIKSQKVALIFVGICGLAFYQSGQGFRGDATFAELPSYLYYIALNFTSWYTHSAALDALQFVLTAGLIACAAVFLKRKMPGGKIGNNNDGNDLVRLILLNFLALYCVAILFKVLSLLPTRHMLYLSPILFIGGAAGLDYVLKKRTEARALLQAALIFTMAVLGIACLFIRQNDARDMRPHIYTSDDIALYGIYDSSYDLYYYLKDAGLNAEFINPNSLETGKTYLYVSHSEPFKTALADWQNKMPITVETEWSRSAVQNVYFTAYNPNFKKLRFSRPNSLYQTKFKVTDIRKTGL